MIFHRKPYLAVIAFFTGKTYKLNGPGKKFIKFMGLSVLCFDLIYNSVKQV